MRVLGIHDGHNASACLMIDGRLIAAAQEERFTKVKNWSGFPAQAIQFVLDYGGCSGNDIDCIAMAGHNVAFPETKDAMMRSFRDSSKTFSHFKGLLKRTPARGMVVAFRKRRRLQELRRVGLDVRKALFVEHHLAHASAAYFGSGWAMQEGKVLVLTNDGEGDGLCATVNVGDSGRLERLSSVPISESIGNIYAMITFIMGMVPLEHEYKLMGMAPYAPRDGCEEVYTLLRDLVCFPQSDGLVWRRTKRCPETWYTYDVFKRLLELKRFDWICGGVQRFTEEILATWVRNCVLHTGIGKVALGGGVFMNVKANKIISELAEIDSLFVFPSCGDETNSMGAAYWASSRENSVAGGSVGPVEDLYLGPAYHDQRILLALRDEDDGTYTFSHERDIEEKAAHLLAEGNIVARFKGRMEFGARALGNRSILADPSRPEVVKTINDMIKSRDFWMPFAPSVLAESEDKYIVNPKRLVAPYMIMCFDTTPRFREIQAAIHPYDLTARPQIVRHDWNPEYYRLLKAFERITGRGAILNTSFNLHGYPIVCTPEDALCVFKKSGLGFMLLGDFLVMKARC